MCGILGVVAHSPVNQLLYDGLLLLQHRGQDAAGIVTAENTRIHMYKAPGMVRDVFRTRNMRSLPGALYMWMRVFSAVTMPAASWPRCCRRSSPS